MAEGLVAEPQPSSPTNSTADRSRLALAIAAQRCCGVYMYPARSLAHSCQVTPGAGREDQAHGQGPELWVVRSWSRRHRKKQRPLRRYSTVCTVCWRGWLDPGGFSTFDISKWANVILARHEPPKGKRECRACGHGWTGRGQLRAGPFSRVGPELLLVPPANRVGGGCGSGEEQVDRPQGRPLHRWLG